jgi:hypothetical protein
MDTEVKKTLRNQNDYGRAGFKRTTFHAMANPAVSARLAGIQNILLAVAQQK